MGEGQPQLPTTDDRDAWRGYWTGQGMPWRTEPEINAERQAYLAERRTVKPDIEKGVYPFRDENGSIDLNRADVEWLLATRDGGAGPIDWQQLEQKSAIERTWAGFSLDLRGSNLCGESLRALPMALIRGGLSLEEWRDAIPEQREWAAAHFEGADLYGVHLEGATLRGAHFEGARLTRARLERARLRETHFEGARMFSAHLEGAVIDGTHFESKQILKEDATRLKTWKAMFPTELLPTNLQGVYLDDSTELDWPILSARGKYGSALLADVRWNGANLATVEWSQIVRIGEEYSAAQSANRAGRVRSPTMTMHARHRTVRAYRQLASVLRDQGINDHADRFAYRGQVLQRQVLLHQGYWPRYCGSLLLDLVAGYGYRPVRSVVTYMLVVLAFAAIYFVLAPASLHLTPAGAIVTSMVSFHGRGFFPGMPDVNGLFMRFVAAEALCGLLIEIVFIATFTNRFFAR